MLHYLISSPGNTGPDENSDYQHRPERGIELSLLRIQNEELLKRCREAEGCVEVG